MSKKSLRIQLTVLGLALMACATAVSCSSPKNDMTAPPPGFQIADVPVAALVHHTKDPTEVFPELFPLQIAVYWTNPNEGVLGIVHCFQSMGIPFFVTRNLQQALGHRLMVIYPSVDASTFSVAQTEELKRHMQGGGSLFAINVVVEGSVGQLFGLSDVAPSRQRYQVKFSADSDPILRYLNRPEEMEVPLGAKKYGEIFWTNGYKEDGSSAVVARFEDGSAAMLRKTWGKGKAYLCGLSFHDVILRSQVNRDFDAERHYVNAFEPGSDVWMLLLRAWYETMEPAAVTVSAIPNGQKSVVLLSHDVDWENSFVPSLAFAKMEAGLKTHSTFFIQTKYVGDANSRAFFFGDNLEITRQLFRDGSSIGSHSIIHSRGFNKFTLGTGEESYPAYQPRGTGFDTATGADVFGEVRVSKQLLDGGLSGHRIDFFRAGHLRVPATLPEALQRSGYRFDSSFTADDVLTNFPYALPLGLLFEEDSGIFEFPVTIDDSENPPLTGRLKEALEIILANAENGAISVVLIHPTDSQEKLRAEEALLRGLPEGVTATDMESYARFWRARDRLEWSVKTTNNANVVDLAMKSEEDIEGLTFEFQRKIISAEGQAAVLTGKRHLVVPLLKGGEPRHVLIYFERLTRSK